MTMTRPTPALVLGPANLKMKANSVLHDTIGTGLVATTILRALVDNITAVSQLGRYVPRKLPATRHMRGRTGALPRFSAKWSTFAANWLPVELSRDHTHFAPLADIIRDVRTVGKLAIVHRL